MKVSTALAPGLAALTSEYCIPMYIHYHRCTVDVEIFCLAYEDVQKYILRRCTQYFIFCSCHIWGRTSLVILLHKPDGEQDMQGSPFIITCN